MGEIKISFSDESTELLKNLGKATLGLTESLQALLKKGDELEAAKPAAEPKPPAEEKAPAKSKKATAADKKKAKAEKEYKEAGKVARKLLHDVCAQKGEPVAEAIMAELKIGSVGELKTVEGLQKLMDACSLAINAPEKKEEEPPKKGMFA